MRRNSRSVTVESFGRPERRSRRTVSAMRAESRQTMSVRPLAEFYEGRLGRSAPSSLRALRATEKAIKAVYLRQVPDEKAVEDAMMTLPASYGADQLGEWYVFTKWAIQKVGRYL